MPLYEFEGKRPVIHPTAWIAPSADIIGDVQVGPQCYVGWKAVLRGDHGRILIEEGSAVEEGVLIHTSAGFTSRIGPMATLGHGAVLHSATIEEFAVVGIGATVCNYAKVGRWSIIGEAGLVKSNQEIPAEVIAVGQPVTILGPIRPEHRERWMKSKRVYMDFTVRNREGLREILSEARR
ncbi:MAG: gamma carbonic anhydrase family protein [Thermodesulfobacteriota bacterium]